MIQKTHQFKKIDEENKEKVFIMSERKYVAKNEC
jgi:hypothetical protein